MLVYIAIGLVVLSVILIAAAIPESSLAVAYAALALVVLGVIIQFAAVAMVTKVMVASADTLACETRRTDELGLARMQEKFLAGCRLATSAFVEKVSGSRPGCP